MIACRASKGLGRGYVLALAEEAINLVINADSVDALTPTMNPCAR